MLIYRENPLTAVEPKIDEEYEEINGGYYAVLADEEDEDEDEDDEDDEDEDEDDEDDEDDEYEDEDDDEVFE